MLQQLSIINNYPLVNHIQLLYSSFAAVRLQTNTYYLRRKGILQFPYHTRIFCFINQSDSYRLTLNYIQFKVIEPIKKVCYYSQIHPSSIVSYYTS